MKVANKQMRIPDFLCCLLADAALFLYRLLTMLPSYYAALSSSHKPA